MDAVTLGMAKSYADKKKVGKGDYWIDVSKAPGIKYNGTNDDSAAFQALLDTIPAAAGNEIGGAILFFPKGVMLLNTATSGVIANLYNKPNVTLLGTGKGSRIRTSTATAVELLRVDNCTNFQMQNICVQVIGTANITRAIHFTSDSPGSVHNSQFMNLLVTANGNYRKAYDISCTSGSPTIWSAQAAFAAGDVGGNVMLNLTGGPFFSTITARAQYTATLASSMDATQTTLTLSSAISGAPASGFTIQVDTERMYVTAGGNTTSLTVSRGRGPGLVKTTHASGATVTTYSATLADNAPSTASTATVPARIQPAGQAVMQHGLCIGNDHPGASNLDIANTSLIGVTVDHAAVAGVRVGNGTAGNILDQWAYGLTIHQCGIGVFTDGGSISIHGGDFSTNVVDYKRYVTVSQEVEISGIRSEGPAIFYEATGAATAGPGVKLSAIEVVTFSAEDGVPLRHLNSGSLLMENCNFRSSGVAQGTVLFSIAGTSSSPCHLTAINTGTSGGNGDPFSSVTSPTCLKTVIGVMRMNASAVVAANTVTGFTTDLRMSLGGGLVKRRTTVADAAYTVLNSDLLVVYTSLTAARAVTLPAQGGTLPAGQELTIKDESGSCDGTKTITITPPSGTIDGASSVVINTAYGKATVYTNGTNWFTR